MKGTIIPITFVAITKEQVRDEKNIFLYEGLSKKLIAKKRLIIKNDKKNYIFDVIKTFGKNPRA